MADHEALTISFAARNAAGAPAIEGREGQKSTREANVVLQICAAGMLSSRVSR